MLLSGETIDGATGPGLSQQIAVGAVGSDDFNLEEARNRYGLRELRSPDALDP